MTVQMPKPRGKAPQAPKSAAKAAKPSGKRIKKEPDQTRSATFNAPVANMRVTRINPHLDENMDLSERSERSMLAERSSSTEQPPPDASYPGLTRRTRHTNHHGLPFDGFSWQEESRSTSVQGSSTALDVYLGGDPASYLQPGRYEYGVTRDEAQGPSALRGPYHYPGSSAMTNVPTQVRRHQDHQDGHADRMRSNELSPYSPAPRPHPPKVESVYHCNSNFSGSATGLAGYQNENQSYTQSERIIHPGVGNLDDFSLPYANDSLSSAYIDSNPFSAVQTSTWNDGNMNLMNLDYPSNEDIQQNYGTLDSNIPQYQTSDMNIPPSSSSNSANQSIYRPSFGNRTSPGPEHPFGPYQRQF